VLAAARAVQPVRVAVRVRAAVLAAAPVAAAVDDNFGHRK
jgi:hypothetical protein